MNHTSVPSSNHALRVRLAEIDREVAELQRKLDNLARARIPIVDALESIIYPILTLPPEITAEIFLRHVAEYPLGLPHSYRELSGPPLLASVCRAWRHIAVNLQTLWSNITMHQTVTESMLEFCLPRAGRRPLTLDLDLTGGNAERNFAAAGQYSMQWESFACELNLPLAFSIDDVQGKLPCLKKLRLDAYGTADSTSPPINAFFDAPQLREVDLDQITLPLISLPWAQLTDLKLWRTNAAEIVEMLRETRHLEKLTVHSPDPFSATPPTPLLLHHLHTLVLPDTSYLDLLDGINLPALEVLVLDWGTETALSALLGLFARSRCPLRSISMTDPSYSISLPIFEAIPSVNEVRLYLQDYPWLWDDGWLPFLQRLTTDAEFLPNLQTLDLEWDILTVPLELVEMLESRCHRRSDESKTLKALKVQCQLPQDKLEVDPDLVDRLRILVADGLTLELPPFYLIDGGVWTAA